MKSKTISKILSAKFDAFVKSISDESLKMIVRNNTIITGGCIVSMLLKENVNDYDLYFKTHDAALAVAKHYCEQFKAGNLSKGYEVEAVTKDGRITISVNKSKNVSVAGEEPKDEWEDMTLPEGGEATDPATMTEAADNIEAAKLEDGKATKDTPRYSPLFLSSNAITLSTKVQLIIRFYGDPDAIHANYDFAHCTSYWTSWDRKLTLRPEAMEAILCKELRYVGSKYPVCSIIRTRKFLSRGWTINAGQYVKMCWQVSKLNLEDIEVLKDQLVGVDSAYFNQLIWKLTAKEKEARENGEPTSIDNTYLMTLIDKIF